MGTDRRRLRNLLLDCRAALRRADPGFIDTPLRAEIDVAIARLEEAAHAPAADAAQVAAAEVAAMPSPAAAAGEPDLVADAARGHARPQQLGAVLAGGRSLDAAEREACVGEAMVRSGFSLRTDALAAMDDAALARLLLEEMPAPEWPVNSTWTRRSTR